ncbi:MAG: hypothetical protein HRT88_13030 [Lentisphaeraceae bacterium]|nr:hypothetical protein [Lentisphaeraceae bacterium]
MHVFYIATITALLIALFAYFLLMKLWPIRNHDAKARQLLKKNDSELFTEIEKLSSKMSIPMETIIYVHCAIMQNQDEDIDAEEICRNFLDLVKDIYSKSSKEGMKLLQISSSEQLGTIVSELTKNNLVPPLKKIEYAEFKGLFEA